MLITKKVLRKQFVKMQKNEYRTTKCYCAKNAFCSHTQGYMKKKSDNIMTQSRESMANKKDKSSNNYQWVKIKQHEYDNNYCGPTKITTTTTSTNSSQLLGQINSMDSSRRSSTTTISSSSGITTYCSCHNSQSCCNSSQTYPVSSKCSKFSDELNKPLKYTSQRNYYENLRKQSEQQHVDLGVAGAINVANKSNKQYTDLCQMKTVRIKPMDIYHNRAYIRSLQEFRLRHRMKCFFE